MELFAERTLQVGKLDHFNSCVWIAKYMVLVGYGPRKFSHLPNIKERRGGSGCRNWILWCLISVLEKKNSSNDTDSYDCEFHGFILVVDL